MKASSIIRCRTLSWRLVVLLGLCLLGSSSASTSSITPETHLQEQRSAFLAANEALRKGDRQHFRNLKNQLTNYVLYPYLEYAELRRYLSYATPGQVNEFLDEYADTPLAYQLRGAWLKLLARQEQWQEYLNTYVPNSSTSAHCRAVLAKIKTGKFRGAIVEVKDLWLVGRSQPRACDPVFTYWREAGYLTQELVWKRIELAMEGHRTRLARYLEQYLPEDERTWAELWRRVDKDPQLVLRHNLFASPHPMRSHILVHGIERLARRDAGEAARAWQQVSQRYQFTDAQQALVARAIALRMARQNHPNAMEALAAVPASAVNEQVHDWRLRNALQRGHWNKLLEWTELLPKELGSQEKWRYWRARSLAQMGRDNESKKYFAGLSLSRSYYGFLAADRLGMNYNLQHNPLPGSEGELQALYYIPAIQRAYELLQLNRTVDARREWRQATSGMSKAQLQRAGKLAYNWGWYDRAIFTIAQAQHWDDLVARFPLAYREPVERNAKLQALDAALVYAVLRQESAFAQDARSPAGALGLMQLMPQTAQQIARQVNTTLPSSTDLLSAELNIQLGTAYLRKVLDKLDRNTLLAVAAYNAGPRRVRGWLPESRTMPADIWIETIPFNETRNYLQRVLAYTVIYEKRLGQEPTRLTHRMKPIGRELAITQWKPTQDQSQPTSS